MTSAEIKELLLQRDIEFKRLHDRHQGFERRLDQLNKRTFLSSDEEREKMEIKKQKLSIKDQMQLFIERYRVQNR
jgi:uncharacterized protein YdcH (DUF465 family)